MPSTSRPPIVDAFLAEAAPDRRAIIEAVDEVIRRRSPEIEVGRTGRMLGYGPFHYRYESGREGDTYVVTMRRRFDTIAMRVHADQSPRLAVEGDPSAVDLAQWGNRSLALSARPGACLAGPGSGGSGAR